MFFKMAVQSRSKHGPAAIGLILCTFCMLSCRRVTDPPTESEAAHFSKAPDVTPVESRVVSQGGIHLAYDFTLSDRRGVVDMWMDGPLLKVEQSWETGVETDHRWSAERILLLFDSDERTLELANLELNRVARLDEGMLEDLSARGPRVLEYASHSQDMGGAPISSLPINDPDAITPPGLAPPPQWRHPPGCKMLNRTLPAGLSEESCFVSFYEARVNEDACESLLDFGGFIAPMAKQHIELEAVSAVADALSQRKGMIVSQHRFGAPPPTSRSETKALSPGERIFTLKESAPCTLKQEDMALPDGRFELVPLHGLFSGEPSSASQPDGGE